MKLTFLLELLLIFVIIAFAASKPIEQTENGRAIRQAPATDAAFQGAAAPVAAVAAAAAPADEDDDDDDDGIDLFDAVAGADDDDEDDDDDDEDGDGDVGDIAEIIGFADEEETEGQVAASVQAEEDGEEDDDDDDDEEDDDDEDDDTAAAPAAVAPVRSPAETPLEAVAPVVAAAAPAAESDSDDGPFDIFEGFFGDDDEEDDDEYDDDDDDDDDDEVRPKPPAASAQVAAAPAPAALSAQDTTPTKIASIVKVPEIVIADAPIASVNAVPLDLAHTPALLQLAQTAANEVDATNLEPIVGGTKLAKPVVSSGDLLLNAAVEQTAQQVVNQLSEPVANAKQNVIEGDEDDDKPDAKSEEDPMDIVESFIEVDDSDMKDEAEDTENEAETVEKSALPAAESKPEEQPEDMPQKEEEIIKEKSEAEESRRM